MQGTSDAQQLELVYALCGSPIPPPPNVEIVNPLPFISCPSSANYDISIFSASVLDGSVYNFYKELQGWDKNPISMVYPPNLAKRFHKLVFFLQFLVYCTIFIFLL